MSCPRYWGCSRACRQTVAQNSGGETMGGHYLFLDLGHPLFTWLERGKKMGRKLELKRMYTHFNTLQHTATHYNTLQHTATHCNTLQHTATHCTLQHTASCVGDKKIGRKLELNLAASFYALGTLLQVLAPSLPALLAGRSNIHTHTHTQTSHLRFLRSWQVAATHTHTHAHTNTHTNKFTHTHTQTHTHTHTHTHTLGTVLQETLQCVVVCCSVVQCIAVGYSGLQCVAVCCSVLQCVAVCCSVLQSVAV